jgi:hypothetical protein
MQLGGFPRDADTREFGADAAPLACNDMAGAAIEFAVDGLSARCALRPCRRVHTAKLVNVADQRFDLLRRQSRRGRHAARGNAVHDDGLQGRIVAGLGDFRTLQAGADGAEPIEAMAAGARSIEDTLPVVSHISAVRSHALDWQCNCREPSEHASHCNPLLHAEFPRDLAH